MMKVLGIIGRILLAGLLIVRNCIMNVIGFLISAITSSK